MKNLYMMLVVLLLAFSPAAIAADSQETKEFRGEALNARSAHLGCAVELANAHLDLNAAHGVDVTAQKSLLAASHTTVTDAATAGEKKPFDEAAKKLREDLGTVRKDIQEQRKELRGTVKGDDAKKMRDDLKIAQQGFQTCTKEAVQKAADAAKNRRDAASDKWQKRLDDMKARGVDTAKMQEVLDKAKENTAKLDEAGDDVEKIKQARKDIRNAELHSHANFAIERVRATIKKAEAKATEKSITVDFSSATKLLDEAAAMAAPGKEYTEGEFQATWSKIQDAGKAVKDALKNARAENKAEKKMAAESNATTGDAQ